MAGASDKARVQAALAELAATGPFFAVSYDPATKAALPVDESGPTVAPSAAYANELSASFRQDTRHGRDNVRQRQDWLWQLTCRFPREVSSTRFEDNLLASPPVLERTAEFPFQATLNLLGAAYQHPIQQQPHTGSTIEFTFEVRLSRR